MIVTDVHLSVSPAIIELLSKVISTATAKEEITPEVGEVLVNLNTIWEEQCYEDNEPWYLKTGTTLLFVVLVLSCKRLIGFSGRRLGGHRRLPAA